MGADIFIEAFIKVEPEKLKEFEYLIGPNRQYTGLYFQVAHWHGWPIAEWFSNNRGVGNCERISIDLEELEELLELCKNRPEELSSGYDFTEEIQDLTGILNDDKLKYYDCDLYYICWY